MGEFTTFINFYVKPLKGLVKYSEVGEQQEHSPLRPITKSHSSFTTQWLTHTLLWIGFQSHQFSPTFSFTSFSNFHSVFFPFPRDVLPFTLKLPEAIASARTSADLEEVAKLGSGLWFNIFYLCVSIIHGGSLLSDDGLKVILYVEINRNKT